MRIARFLGWREFVVAFFVLAFASSVPNLFIGINSAFHKIPLLSFGDVVGGNIVDLSLAVGLAVLIAKTPIPARSQMIQSSSIFTIGLAILPLILILDGTLGREDGILLISIFFFYIFWLFSKEERFKKIYEIEDAQGLVKEFRVFLKDLAGVGAVLVIILLTAEGVVRSTSFFAEGLNLPVALIGILVVGLVNALPETYFALVSAKKGHTEMVLGNLMGSIVAPATLVLGTVALICPIKIVDFSPFAIARLFLIISALFFLLFIRTDRKITKKEGLFLLSLYISFVIAEVLL